MKKPARLILATFLLAGLSAAQPAAQAPRVTASTELTLFNLDVVVTTPSGDAVHGLKAEDFEIRHGGKLIKATNFHEVRGTAFPAVSVDPIPPADAPEQAARPPRPPSPDRRGASSSSSTGSRSPTRSSGASSSTRSGGSSRRASRGTTRG